MAESTSDRDWFGAELIKREVLAKNRRALVLYGAAHFFRKVDQPIDRDDLEASQAKVFTIWTNAAFELSTVQSDVQNLARAQPGAPARNAAGKDRTCGLPGAQGR